MKILKYTAFVLGGIAALVAAGAVLLIMTFDANRIKGELARVVKESKGRTLAIDGDLSLSFWPGIGVKLGRTRLSESQSDKEFAALEGARVSVAIIPLLSKQLVVDQIQLDGIRATLIRGKDGKFNFDDLLTKEKQQTGEAVRFDVAGVRIRDGQLVFRDEKAGQTFNLRNVNLATGRLGNAAQGALSLAMQVAADKPRLDASVKADADYRYDLEQKQYALSGLEATLSGTAAGLQGLDAKLAAGTLELKPESSEIELEKVMLSAKGKADADEVDIKVDAPKLIAGADRASGQSIAIAATLAGTQRHAQVKLDLSGVEGSASALRIAGCKLDLDARQGETTVRGALEATIAANLSAQSVALPKFSGTFDVANPQMPMKSVKLPVSGSARADFAKSNASGDIASRFDESSIRAKWGVPKFSPLALTFDVDVDRINVDKYFPPQAHAEPTGPEKPFDFSALKALDASGSVKVGSLQVRNVKASNITLQIRAAKGKLEINPMAANLYQGALAGNMSLNANNNQLALKQNLTGVNINPLMKDAIDKDLVEGHGNISVDVTTSGNTVTAMKKGLDGSARVALKDGALKGINLAKTFREVKAQINMKQDMQRQASENDKTDFSELNASFRIRNGVAHNSDLSAKSPFLRLAGEGDIDIGAGRMNYLAKASVVGTSAGQEGKELAQLKGLTIPVRITGPFDKLTYDIDLASLATGLAKSKLDSTVQEQQQLLEKKAQQKLQDSLKGLFGK